MTGWALPDAVLREAPAYAPRPRELADLELLLSGALAPVTGFPTRTELAGITQTGRLPDGTPWPTRLRLDVPASLVAGLDLADPARRLLVLADPEGTPLAALDVRDVWPAGDDRAGVGGPVRRLGESVRGTFRDLRLTPEQVRSTLPEGGRVLAVFADRPLHRPQLAQIAYAARTIAGHVLVLVPVAEPGPDGLAPEALVRTVLAARDRLPSATVVAVPLTTSEAGSSGGGPATLGEDVADAIVRSRIAENFGATHLLAGGAQLTGGGPRILLPRELAYDGRDGQWRAADDIPPRHRRTALPPDEIQNLLDRGITLPSWHTPPAVADELARARPPRAARGLVVLLTGLPGSGKSTLARGVADELNETGERTVTLIDGDVARRYLTAGLGTTRADRDEALRRIGFVAAEAARHGGLVLCCPVAPRAATRGVVRELALATGAGFLLVHVATPRQVCEQRDPRGRAALAGKWELAGEEYEAPTDADLVIDNSQLSADQSVKRLLEYLTVEGWLDRP